MNSAYPGSKEVQRGEGVYAFVAAIRTEGRLSGEAYLIRGWLSQEEVSLFRIE